MITGEGVSLLIITLLIGSTLTIFGRLVLALGGGRHVSRSSESWALAAILGTSVAILVLGVLSHGGCTMPAALTCWLLVCAGLVIAAGWRGALRNVLRLPRKQAWPLGMALAIAAVVALLPMLRHGSYYPFSDVYAYVTMSDWLQSHSFNQTWAFDPAEPHTQFVAFYQQHQLRMGSTFLLAAVEAACGGTVRGLELLPAVVAWGAMLNVLSLYLLGRWVLRMPRALAASIGIVAFATVNPLHLSMHHGYLPQLLSLSVLSTCIAVASRLLASANWRLSWFLIIATLIAATFSIYSEILPVVMLAAIPYSVMLSYKAYRRQQLPRLLTSAAWGAAALVLAANVEIFRAAHAIPFQMSIVMKSGTAWSVLELATYMLGAAEFGFTHGARRLGLAVLLAALLCCGCLALVRRYRSVSLWSVLAVYLAMAMWFAIGLWEADSHNSRAYSLFKLAQWSFPLVVTLQVAGLAVVLRRLRVPTLGGFVCALILCGVFLPSQMREAQVLAAPLQSYVNDPRPFAAIAQLRGAMQTSGITQAFWVDEQVGRYPHNWNPYLFPGVVWENPWRYGRQLGVGQGPVVDDQSVTDITQGVTLISAGRNSSGSMQELAQGWKYAQLDEFCLVEVYNPNYGIQTNDVGTPFCWLGEAPLRMKVFSTQQTLVRVQARLSPGPAIDGSQLRTVEFASGDKRVAVLAVGSSATVSVPLPVQVGENLFTLRCLDAPQHRLAEMVEGAHHGALLVHVTDWELLPQQTNTDPTLPVDGEEQLLIAGDVLPFEQPITGGQAPGCLAMPAYRSSVIAVDNPNYGLPRTDSGEPFFWLGSSPARVEVNVPREGTYLLSFVAEAGPAIPTTSERSVELHLANQSGQPPTVLQLDPGDSAVTYSVAVSLPSGRSSLDLRCLDEPLVTSGDLLWDGRPAALLVKLSHLELQASVREAAMLPSQ